MATDEGTDQPAEARRRPGARDLLRRALVNDEDPRFPWWLPLPGALVVGALAGYEGLAGDGASTFFSILLWPGSGLFALITVAAFFGWQLDID